MTISHDTPLKRCSKCRREFPLTAEYFYRASGKKSGFQSACKSCWKTKSIPIPLPDRFWPRVAITNNPNDCWEWTGYRARNGYGQFGYKRKLQYSHRIAYELFYGKSPEGLLVCHRCDNPACCNPLHLFLGTSLDNNRDMVTKGRSASPEQKVHRGEDHGRHKLTNEQVIYIRQRYAQGGITQKTLADEFGVSKSAIGLIIINRNWKHLESD